MITLEANQQSLRGGQKLSRQSLQKLARLVDQKVKNKKDLNVSLAFVSPGQMKRLNRAYRGKNQVTDVLSFAFDESPDQTLGEIIICYPAARQNAKTGSRPARREVYRLIIHGLLHLFGFEHASQKGADKMFTLQETILKKI